ncbi:uncharacterized protein LOC127115245 [Lathyrus oleraceus]|uniref:uncharacterized protein LOC127115245 n=1 Tax=Pisum sativum TaxID=3888 RepID=UPI0021D242A7|nr:uncharacterized protein LOC127115245 [Pisum sativum]
MQHLFKMIEDSNHVYWSRKKDESEFVRDILWAHPESMKLLNMFPNVLIMDKNRYNIILVSLGYNSLTLFPMTTSHSPNVSIYCIGFVNQDHWVQINMNEGFPLPPVTLDWKKYRTLDATSWMIGFVGQL